MEKYGLIPFSASDNHSGKGQRVLGGMAAETPITDERDFVSRIFAGKMRCIKYDTALGSEGVSVL